MNLCVVLFVVLLTLKLSGVLILSWWLMCLPLIAMPCLFILGAAVMVAICYYQGKDKHG